MYAGVPELVDAQFVLVDEVQLGISIKDVA